MLDRFHRDPALTRNSGPKFIGYRHSSFGGVEISSRSRANLAAQWCQASSGLRTMLDQSAEISHAIECRLGARSNGEPLYHDVLRKEQP